MSFSKAHFPKASAKAKESFSRDRSRIFYFVFHEAFSHRKSFTLVEKKFVPTRGGTKKDEFSAFSLETFPNLSFLALGSYLKRRVKETRKGFSEGPMVAAGTLWCSEGGV